MFAKCLSFFFVVLSTASGVTEPHQPEPRLGDRIVGGIPMDITQAPWQVSLQKDGSHYCGGSIISQTWILTSAYCTTLLYNKDVLEVRIGSSYHMVGELYRVIDIIQHHRFNRDNMDFDFALLLLERPLNFGNSIQPVRLPNFGEFPTDNTICLVTGWGDTKNPNESRVQLRGVYLPIVNQQQCNNAYKDYGGITSRMICAGIYPAGGKDACKMDSGGPLVTFDSYRRATQLGIVSWGLDCGKPNYPGVYGNVIAVREWIYDIADV